MKIGFSAQNLEFTSHASVQNVLHRMWFGEVSDATPSLWIWMATVFPLAIYMVHFHNNAMEAIVRRGRRNRAIKHSNSWEVRREKKRKERWRTQWRRGDKDEQEDVGDEQESCDDEGGESETQEQRLKRLRSSLGSDEEQRIALSRDVSWASETEYKDVEVGDEASDGKQIPVFVSQTSEDNPNDVVIPNGKKLTQTTASSNVEPTDKDEELTWRKRILFFYSSPMVKFRLHLVSYFSFLALFSYIMLGNFHAEVSMFEMVLIFWVGSLFCEEVRQMAQTDSRTWRGRLRIWFTDYWNRMDVVNLALFTLGFFLRLSPSSINAARIVLCINLMLFFVRVLNSFLVIKRLGPKLLMIGRMLVDLILFICILLVFLLSYGIASHAIMYPNESDPHTIFRGILYQSYFQVFGELFLDNIEGPADCTTNVTMISAGYPECVENSWTGLVLLAGYMLISNVLLLNLLIAMFSYTFTEVQDNTDAIWKYLRYQLINEYIDKPFLIPPFIVFFHVYIFFKFLSLKCNSDCRGRQSAPDHEDEVSLMRWETLQLESYIAKERNGTIHDIGQQVEVLTKQMDTVENTLKRHVFFEKRFAKVEEQVNDIHTELQYVIDLLKKRESS